MSETNLHIYRPGYLAKRFIRVCEVCKRRTRHVLMVYEWHSTIRVCCRCGACNGRRDGSPRIAENRRLWEKHAMQARADWQDGASGQEFERRFGAWLFGRRGR
jgi:hypothetical protein